IAFVRQFDEDNIPQFGLGKVGNAYVRFIAFHTNPLMLFTILQIFGQIHGIPSYTNWLNLSYYFPHSSANCCSLKPRVTLCPSVTIGRLINLPSEASKANFSS